MDGRRGRVRSSSGRRRPEREPSFAAAIVVGALAVLALVVVMGRLDRAGSHRQSPVGQASVQEAATASPTRTPTSTPSPTPTSTEVSEEPGLPPSATPTRTPEPWPPVEPGPTATPTPRRTLADCIDFRWTTLQTWVPPRAFVNIEIDVLNRCGRDFQPLELWFEVRGFRRGELIQVARGHPFDRVSQRFSTRLTIALPGSQDWYDRITVEIVEP